MNRKMIYVLNHYASNSVQHFFHVINLLEKIADNGIEIALIIEKCEDLPEIRHKNIHVYAQKEKKKGRRARELYRIVKKLINEGYKKIYIRISIMATLIICKCAHKYGAEVYYWQSGDAFSFYDHLTFPYNIRWKIKSYIPYYFVKESVDYFVTGPETMLDYYAAEGKVKREKLRLLYNDIDTERFHSVTEEEKNEIKKQLGLEEKKTYILQVHRFSDYRKTDFYIPYIMETFRDREDLILLIIGSGAEENIIRQKIRHSGLNNIQMLGSKPNAMIQNYYKACDIFINPSNSEGFPRVVIEAMASGKPVVATAAGGTRDLFSKVQKPFIIDVENREEFREKLQKMLDDTDLQRKCMEANLEQVKKYATENVAKMYIELLWGDMEGQGSHVL